LLGHCVLCRGFTGSNQHRQPGRPARSRQTEASWFIMRPMNLAEAYAVIGAFEKRYPFIKVRLNRIGRRNF